MPIFSHNRGSLIYPLLSFLLISVLVSIAMPASAVERHVTNERLTRIDGHNHLAGTLPTWSGPITDYDGAAYAALSTMNRLGIKKMIFAPPPFSPHHPGIYDISDLADIVKKHPNRFAFLGGGESLNVMIQKSVHSGRVTPRLKQEFEKKALEILDMGAVGFGELAAEHFSFNPRHPYEWAPPDHPLFLLLADIAAHYNVPIAIHMEAVPEDMPLPSHLTSPRNPRLLHSNIAAFERLLTHNQKAKIVWVHVGWDNTGYRTVKLCRELLKKHQNLYMSIKISPLDSLPENCPIDGEGKIKPEWLRLFSEFSDRFCIGSDQFFLSPRMHRHIGPSKSGKTNKILSLLPLPLARKIGYENPRAIFNLKD